MRLHEHGLSAWIYSDLSNGMMITMRNARLSYVRRHATHWWLLWRIRRPVELEGGCPDANLHICEGLQGAALPLAVLSGQFDSLPPSGGRLARQPQLPPLRHCSETLLLHRTRKLMSLFGFTHQFQCRQALAGSCTLGNIYKAAQASVLDCRAGRMC